MALPRVPTRKGGHHPSSAKRKRTTRILFNVGFCTAVSFFLASTYWSAFRMSTPNHLSSSSLPVFLEDFVRSKVNLERAGKGGSAAAAPNLNAGQIYTTKSTKAPFLTSRICGGCMHVPLQRQKTCGDLIRSLQKDQPNLSDEDAAREISRLESKLCAACNPDACPDGTKYWRFDHAAPAYSSPVTYYLESIPEKHRVPPSRLAEAMTFFEEKWLKNETDFLFEYNPSIVRLPAAVKESLDLGGDEASYIVSFRVTSANNCFPTKVYETIAQKHEGWWDAVLHTPHNHLALALLRSDLSVVPGHEVVIDLAGNINKTRKCCDPPLMDYRLFATDDTIYLNANTQGTAVIAPLAITTGKSKVPAEGILLSNLYGGGKMRVSMLHPFNTIWNGGASGKNYALFQTKEPGYNTDELLAEISIKPHEVHRIKPGKFNQLRLQQVFWRIWKPGSHKSRKDPMDQVLTREAVSVGEGTKSEISPDRSFLTVEELWFTPNPFKDFAHGGACCVQLDGSMFKNIMSEDEHLLVGIGHTKTPWKPWYMKASKEEVAALPHTHYVSLFYAFEPKPPYNIRARSGYFCFGFSSEDEEKVNPYAAGTRNRPFSINNEMFDCPQVHFVSSITEKAGDDTKAVVGYGINDCTSRIIEVDKTDIARHLFPDKFAN